MEFSHGPSQASCQMPEGPRGIMPSPTTLAIPVGLWDEWTPRLVKSPSHSALLAHRLSMSLWSFDKILIGSLFLTPGLVEETREESERNNIVNQHRYPGHLGARSSMDGVALRRSGCQGCECNG
ncbi:hypothetical protein NUU61_006263 [Penicillium alfredii]|uniref:Uncharacterized protein n=1 Tax=Penicillium alfredii TaxID=1506179 RepID=A0A9W9K365_9EURO|nr:uncharacterized protein NUU61_006263 [Penicillium alfredii]KAJ5091393.1 hypothetical protein NUU61_006263 [Penicillium alfredii]